MDLQQFIQVTLLLSVEKLTEVMKVLEDAGADSLADLAFCEVEDFLGILKPVQIRKLLYRAKEGTF